MENVEHWTKALTASVIQVAETFFAFLPNVLGSVILVLLGWLLARVLRERAALAALHEVGASRIVIAVPTGSLKTVEELASQADALYCPNIRGGWSFAVADAYRRWGDVDEEEAREILARVGRSPSASP